jgi:hypothetical protein
MQKLQRKLLDQGRRVKRTEEELAILKKTKKEVEETVTLWTGQHQQLLPQSAEHHLRIQSYNLI